MPLVKEKLVQPVVLVVDDNVPYCQAVLQRLSTEGIAVWMAHNAHEAAKLIESVTPDLILLDMQMPGMDGLTFLSMLKALPDYSDLPAIVVSGHLTEDDRAVALKAGADQFLEKPLSSDELLDTVKEYL
jgi:two-component system nitrogen regulation response regulator NtrX